MDKIQEEIFNILEKYANVEDYRSMVNLGSNLITELRVNSARLIDIVLDIEEKYDIILDDTVFEKVQTVRDIHIAINKLV